MDNISSGGRAIIVSANSLFSYFAIKGLCSKIGFNIIISTILSIDKLIFPRSKFL